MQCTKQNKTNNRRGEDCRTTSADARHSDNARMRVRDRGGLLEQRIPSGVKGDEENEVQRTYNEQAHWDDTRLG